MSHFKRIDQVNGFEGDFDSVYATEERPHAWHDFCHKVWGFVRPVAIRGEFRSSGNQPMNKTIYYKWEARAWERFAWEQVAEPAEVVHD